MTHIPNWRAFKIFSIFYINNQHESYFCLHNETKLITYIRKMQKKEDNQESISISSVTRNVKFNLYLFLHHNTIFLEVSYMLSLTNYDVPQNPCFDYEKNIFRFIFSKCQLCWKQHHFKKKSK